MNGKIPTRLIDPFGRRVSYMRISVTDRCDFRCFYCMPDRHADFRSREHLLSFEEIEQIVRVFAGLGVSHVRLTGGEPLVRQGVLDLVRRIGRLPGVEDLSMTTNASRLAEHAAALREAGVGRLNVSLDTLRPEVFRRITRNGDLESVLAGLEAARRVGFDLIKINTVAMRGVNEDEVEALTDYCLRKGFTLRFIETMPMGDLGYERQQYYMPLSEIVDRLKARYVLTPAAMRGGGPAAYYQIGDSDLRIGLITPVSKHFCERCNRVRLTSDGWLHLCLGQENRVDLKTLVRGGCSDEELAALIREAIKLKPERHEFAENPHKVIRIMSETGG